MKPSQVLVAKSSGRSVLVSGVLDDHIRVIGTSIPTSTLPGNDVHSFTIYLPDEIEMGVVALSVHTKRFGDKKYGSLIPLLLAVQSRQGEAWLDLEEQWLSLKPVQVYEDRLEVQIGEERFGTRKPYRDGSEQIRYVPDANLLCRHLVDKATADEVRAAAEEAVAEVSRKERIVELEAQVKRFEAETQEHLAAIRGRDGTIEQAMKLQRILSALGQSKDTKILEWRKYAKMLSDILSRRWLLWFLGADLRQALREFPQEPKPSESPAHMDAPAR